MSSDRNLGFDVNAPGTILLIIQTVFLALAWVASSMRAYVKLVLLRKVLIDDYLMLVALLGYTATAYFVISAVVEGGLGEPPGSGNLEITLRSLYGNMVASGPVSGLVRVSIALFLLRIAVKRWHRIVLHTIIGTTVSTTLVYFFMILFQCSPPSRFWEVGPGSCDHGLAVSTATLVWGSLSAAMDWVLGVLPIIVLWNVQINRQSKVGIVALLGFGIIAGIALIIRLVYIAGTKQIQAIPIAITAIIELALGIIAGCIATLPPLFKRIGHQRGSNPKRRPIESIADTLPWQRSITEPEPRPREARQNIVMTPSPPRRPARGQNDGTYSVYNRPDLRGGHQPRPESPMPRRALLPPGRRVDVKGGDIQVHRHIHVASHPTDVDFARKPLPLPPPRPSLKPRDRSISRLRPLSPTLFI
ncbi:hypothetical protein F5Y17DRAFT_35533 [Xylariaceae sp. FL0594]|nr:hypothetical protein F5Y17DRAFT_35533 [Xylariaceae sp. FL0594]